MRGLLTTLLVALPMASAHGADLRDVRVDHEDGTYHVRSIVWFNADIDALYHVFLDWDLSEQFSSVVVESRNTGSDATGDRGFYARNRACVLFYCKSVERAGTVEHEPVRFIRATVDPEQSDFYVSIESWEFEEVEDGTLVTYTLEMKPKFWIPPVVGPYVLKRKLANDSGEALDRIEAIAISGTASVH